MGFWFDFMVAYLVAIMERVADGATILQRTVDAYARFYPDVYAAALAIFEAMQSAT